MYILLNDIPAPLVCLGFRYWPRIEGVCGFEIFAGYHVVELRDEDKSLITRYELYQPDPDAVVVLYFDEARGELVQDLGEQAEMLSTRAPSGELLIHKRLYSTRTPSEVLVDFSYWARLTSRLQSTVGHLELPGPLQPAPGETAFEALWRRHGRSHDNLFLLYQILIMRALMFEEEAARERLCEYVWASLACRVEDVKAAPDYFAHFFDFYQTIPRQLLTPTHELHAKLETARNRLAPILCDVGQETGQLHLIDVARKYAVYTGWNGIPGSPYSPLVWSAGTPLEITDPKGEGYLLIDPEGSTKIRLDGAAFKLAPGFQGFEGIAGGYHEIELIGPGRGARRWGWVHHPGEGAVLRLSWEGDEAIATQQVGASPETQGSLMNGQPNRKRATAWTQVSWALTRPPAEIPWREPPAPQEGQTPFEAWFGMLRGHLPVAIAQVQAQALCLILNNSDVAGERLWQLIELHTPLTHDQIEWHADYISWFLLCMDGLIPLAPLAWRRAHPLRAPLRAMAQRCIFEREWLNERTQRAARMILKRTARMRLG